jgi:glutamyl-tRNA synthetase
MSKNKKVRVRFAPSPTGHLHVGSVRVAIFNWLFARHHAGTYLVRIEDTDQERSTKEFLDSQLSSLKWLDLMPDEHILYQLSRIEEHKKVIQDLLEKNIVYPCFCEPSMQTVDYEKKEETYVEQEQCTCKHKTFSADDLKQPHALRFAVPRGVKTVEFDDAIRGKICVDVDQINDFIVMRKDGIPTYNFVVVLDDIFMNITHVIRGEDHISNTPKQMFIYNALGASVPVFAHLPLILGSLGNRLSKRDAAVSVQDYKRQGFLPGALFNYLVRLGWSHGDQEIFTKEELVQFFDFDHIGKKGAIFDIKKLEWLNGVYIRAMDFDDFLRAIDDIDDNGDHDHKEALIALWEREQLEKLFEQYKARATTILAMVQDMLSLGKAPKVLDLGLIQKWITDQSVDLLVSFERNIATLKRFEHEILSGVAKTVCAEFEKKLVCLAQPLRLALTGKTVSPGVFELMEVLGKEDVLERLNVLIKKLQEH